MGKHFLQALIALLVLGSSHLFATNYNITGGYMNITGKASGTSWWYQLRKVSDGTIAASGGFGSAGANDPMNINLAGSIGTQTFKFRCEVGYGTGGSAVLKYWFESYDLSGADPHLTGGFSGSTAIDGAGNPVGLDGLAAPVVGYGKGILLKNDSKNDRVYTITLKDSSGAIISQEFETLHPGESIVEELTNTSAGTTYEISHDDYAVSADGTGAQVTKTIDASGTLAPIIDSTHAAVTGPDIQSKGTPTTSDGAGVASPSVVGTPSNDTQSMLNAAAAGRAQDKANGDQAHEDANGIRGDLDGIEGKLQGSAEDAMDGTANNASLLSAAQSLPGKMSTLYNDLLGVGSNLGIALSSDTASLNTTVTLGPWGTHTINLDQYSAWWPIIRGLVMAIFSVWFCFETIQSLKGAVS